MSETALDHICSKISEIIATLESLDIALFPQNLVDLFWGLQDWTHRLLALANDDLGAAVRLPETFPTLTRDILQVVERFECHCAFKPYSVKHACEVVRRYVTSLERLAESTGISVLAAARGRYMSC